MRSRRLRITRKVSGARERERETERDRERERARARERDRDRDREREAEDKEGVCRDKVAVETFCSNGNTLL